MTDSFVSAKIAIETYLEQKADDNSVLICAANTGDMLNVSGSLVPAFEQNSEFMVYSVEQDAARNLVVGNIAKRIHGSITLNLISPNGQGNAGEARMTDFINQNLVSKRVENIRLRDVRAIGQYSLEGWDAKIVQIAFELNINNN